MAIQYAPLFALETQFQTKDGRNNTGGWLKVFLAATDDPATTYSDYNGTRNPEKIVLDDDGRAVVICDKSKAYRLEVYSIDGTLLWTEEPVYCSGTGGGGVYITKVISTDGSISIDKNVAGSTTTYDIRLAPIDSDEFLEWIKCSEKDCGATWYPVFQDGSMETEAGKGIKLHGCHFYHFTNSFTVDPDGTEVNYDTFRVSMYCGDVEVDMREFDIDSSLNDPVLCEFSRDVVPSKDTHVYFKLTIPSTCKVSGEVQCHRIYSGINAVPDTCATKQWVSASYQPLSGMSAYIPYVSIGNNNVGQVTGINGSAIAGGLDSASVSTIASSVASAYTESAFSSLSSKADSSALSAYQPVSAMGAYATTAYVDGMVSGKLDSSAFNPADFYPTSNPSGFITGVDLSDYATTGYVDSSVSGKLDTTAFNSGDFYPTSNPSGYITGVDLSDYATTGFVESAVIGKLDTSAFASASAGFAPAGDYAFNSSLGSYIPASSSGAFQPSGDYAFNSAVSSKLDASASGDFVMNAAMTSWIPYSALGYSGTSISSIGGSSLAGMGGSLATTWRKAPWKWPSAPARRLSRPHLHRELNAVHPALPSRRGTGTAQIHIPSRRGSGTARLTIPSRRGLLTSRVHIPSRRVTITPRLTVPSHRGPGTSQVHIPSRRGTVTAQIFIPSRRGNITAQIHIPSRRGSRTAQVQIPSRRGPGTAQYTPRPSSARITSTVTAAPSKAIPRHLR